MPNDTHILFLDLETTGNQVEHDEIIEVGLVMLDANTLEEVGSFTAVARPSDKALMRMVNNKVVREMHKVNGLFDDVIEFDDSTYDGQIGAIDIRVAEWINTFVPGTDHIPYGGSGVSHFDRKFIDKYMTRLSRRITFWAYDVGAVRRTAAKVGYPWLNQDAKNHRALVDARFHAEEFRYGVNAFGRLKTR